MATKTDHKIVLSAQDKTKAALNSLQGSLGRIKGAMFSLQSAAALLAGGAGFGALANNALETVDVLSKMSRRIGISTRELGGLAYAADLSGVSTASLGKGLEGLARRVSEAATGTGKAKDALNELGINAVAFNQIPVSDQLAILADRFQAVTSETDRIRLSYELFGRRGIELINVLEEGSAGLREAQAEANRLGITIDDTRAVAIENFNDSLTRMQAAIQGAFVQGLGNAAPEMENVSNKIRELVVPAVENMIKGFNWFLENLDIITKAFRFFLITLAVNKLISFTLAIIQMSRNLFILAFAAKTSGKALLRGLGGPIVAIAIAIADVTGAIDALLEKMGLGGLTTIAPEAAQALAEADEAAKKMGENLDYVWEITLPEVAEGLDNVKKSADTMSSVFEDNLPKAAEGLDKVKTSAKTMANVFEDNLARGMESATDALTDFMMGTLKAGDAFKQFANGIIRDLIRMQIQQNITKPLFGMIQGFMGGANPIAASRTQAGLVSAGGAFANGGMMPGGKASIVGERGPELVIPNRNSTVVSNEQLQGIGGGDVNVTLNISTGVAQTVRAEIAQLMPQIAAVTKQAVADSRRRGGSFAAAFGG